MKMYIFDEKQLNRLTPNQRAEYIRIRDKAFRKTERRMLEAEQFPMLHDSALVGQYAAIRLGSRWYNGIILEASDATTTIMKVISREITKLPGIEIGTNSNEMRVCWKTKDAFKLNVVAGLMRGEFMRNNIQEAVFEIIREDDLEFRSTRLRTN